MKKIVVKLPKGFSYKIKETKESLEISIEPESVEAIPTVKKKTVRGEVLRRDASAGRFVARRSAAKSAVKKVASKAPKGSREGTGGTGPRKTRKK